MPQKKVKTLSQRLKNYQVCSLLILLTATAANVRILLYEKDNITIKNRDNFMCGVDGICRIVFDTDAK